MNTQNKATTLDNMSKTATPILYHMIPPFAEILMNELKKPKSQIHGILREGVQEIAKDLAREVEALNRSMDQMEENIMESYTQEIYQLKETLKQQQDEFRKLAQKLGACCQMLSEIYSMFRR